MQRCILEYIWRVNTLRPSLERKGTGHLDTKSTAFMCISNGNQWFKKKKKSSLTKKFYQCNFSCKPGLKIVLRIAARKTFYLSKASPRLTVPSRSFNLHIWKSRTRNGPMSLWWCPPASGSARRCSKPRKLSISEEGKHHKHNLSTFQTAVKGYPLGLTITLSFWYRSRRALHSREQLEGGSAAPWPRLLWDSWSHTRSCWCLPLQLVYLASTCWLLGAPKLLLLRKLY